MVKVYSVQIEKQKGHKYKYTQRYVDPLRSKPGHIVLHKVAVTLAKKTPQARREARSILMRKIHHAVAEQSEGTNITLQELSDKYQQYLKETDRPWQTRDRAFSHFRFINAYFKGAIAKNITTPMINKYLEWCLYERPRPLSNSSVKLRKNFISQAYIYGIDHGLVKSNPTRGARITWKNESSKERDKIENKYLTDNELRAILGYLRYVADRLDYYYLFKFMYLTGLRISEASGLKFNDLISKDGLWFVKVTGKEEYHYGELYHEQEEGQARLCKSPRTKTVTGYRKVQLNHSAKDICNQCKKLHPYKSHILLSRTNRPWTVPTVDDYLMKVARKLGISKHLSSHYFRHTYISKQAEKGTPLNVIMAQAGQRDSKVTKEIYTHVTEGERVELQKNLDKMDSDIGI